MGTLALMASTAARSRRYSGRKSCPHSEMQCASSIAKNEMGNCLRNSTVSSFDNVSGATYNNLVPPFSKSSFTSRVCTFDNEELRKCATHSRPAV